VRELPYGKRAQRWERRTSCEPDVMMGMRSSVLPIDEGECDSATRVRACVRVWTYVCSCGTARGCGCGCGWGDLRICGGCEEQRIQMRPRSECEDEQAPSCACCRSDSTVQIAGVGLSVATLRVTVAQMIATPSHRAIPSPTPRPENWLRCVHLTLVNKIQSILHLWCRFRAISPRMKCKF
jgi:hypothetical protein